MKMLSKHLLVSDEAVHQEAVRLMAEHGLSSIAAVEVVYSLPPGSFRSGTKPKRMTIEVAAALRRRGFIDQSVRSLVIRDGVLTNTGMPSHRLVPPQEPT